MTWCRSVLIWGITVQFVSLGTQVSLGQDPNSKVRSDHLGKTSENRMSIPEIASVFRARLQGYPRSRSFRLARHLKDLCHRYDLEPAFVLSVIGAESSFRNRAVSYAGAVGLMQIMPATARYLAKKYGLRYRGVKDLRNPFLNIELGTRYLADFKKKYKGQVPVMLAAYNVGPGRIDQLLREDRFRIHRTRPYIEAVQYGVAEIKKFAVSQPAVSF